MIIKTTKIKFMTEEECLIKLCSVEDINTYIILILVIILLKKPHRALKQPHRVCNSFVSFVIM